MLKGDRFMIRVSIGCTLSSEEQTPVDLVKNAQKAEEAGFEFLSISDHYFPWVDAPRVPVAVSLICFLIKV